MRLVLLALIILTGCAAQSKGRDADTAGFAAVLSGATFDNAVQARETGVPVTSAAFSSVAPDRLAVRWSPAANGRAETWDFVDGETGVMLDIGGPCRLNVVSRGQGAWDAATERCELPNGDLYEARVTVMPNGVLLSERLTPPNAEQSDALPPPPLDLRRR